MKCPSCGAETQNKICEFCGSEMPQEKATINITNNFYGEAAQQNNADSSVGKCPKCGSTKINFKRERIDSSMIEEVILELDMLYDVYYVEDDDTIIIYDDVDYLNVNEDF